MATQVVKRDGKCEDFVCDKISKVLTAAGLEETKAKEVASKISDWVDNQHLPQITSLQIRDQVQVELDRTDTYVAGLFRWYQKTKQPN